MVIFLRILIFALCILPSFSPAAEVSSQLSPEVKIDGNFEYLEKTFVQHEIPADRDSTTISILRPLTKVLILIQEKYYSLLNWKTYSRDPAELAIPNYDRKAMFGTWVDNPTDDNCYNTRALVLMRDSNKTVKYDAENKCVVVGGEWKDDYTSQTFTQREDVQIDHVVPLKNAYLSGGYRWGFNARCLYANFMGNSYHLKTVNAHENMKKGDKSPDKYMPPNKDYTCNYLKTWLTIKFLWNLKMTESEAQSINTLLRDNHCNLYNFRISAREILDLNKFANENMGLCDEVAPAE